MTRTIDKTTAYQAPTIEVYPLSASDIITSSSGDDGTTLPEIPLEW